MVVASPSSTVDGPLMEMVIGSLSEMVAVAALAPFFRESWEESVEVIAPRVTVKLSAVSDSFSSVALMVIVCVAPAAEFAAKVTVPEVAPKSAPSAASVPSGALHATVTDLATAADRVTVKVASEPSATLAVGLAGPATAMASVEQNLPTAKIGYIIAYKVTQNVDNEFVKNATAATLSGAGAAAGGLTTVWVGAKIGTSFGALVAGPVGAVVGAAGGAL